MNRIKKSQVLVSSIRVRLEFTMILVLLLTSATLQAQLKEFEVKDMEPPETQVVQGNTEYPDNAMVLVYSSLPELDFRSTIGGINQQRYNQRAGRYEILITPKKQIIFVASAGFIESRVALINAKPKNVFYYRVEENAKMPDASEGGKGILQINSEPKSASVLLYNVEVTDKTPAKLEINSGRVRVKLKKENHHDFDTVVTVKPEEKTILNIQLEHLQGEVDMKSTPDNASIFINGKKIKETTPARVVLPIGEYNITIKKSGYLDVKRTIVVRNEQTHKLNFTMKTLKGSLQEQSNKYKNAKIIYGLGTVVAIGAGSYFRFSTANLHNEYKTATTDATVIFDKMERHDLYSWLFFGAATPLGIMTIIKAVKQKNTDRKITTTFLPTRNGALFGLTINL